MTMIIIIIITVMSCSNWVVNLNVDFSSGHEVEQGQEPLTLNFSGTTEQNPEVLLQLTGSRLGLSLNHLLIRITYRSFLLAPVEFFAHDLHNTWQRFIGRLHVQEAEAGPASDDIDGSAGVLFYGIQNLRKSTREEESSTSRIPLLWCTSASMYGNSDTSLLPTIGHLCPVT